MMNSSLKLEKPEMDFIKLRISQLCTTVSRGRRRPAYRSAADKVFEKMFGVKDLASRIINCRSYNDMDELMSLIDIDAFFNIIRQSNSYRRLATVINLKYDLEAEKVSPKYTETYKNTIARMIDEFNIHTNIRDAQYEDLKEYARGYRDRDVDEYGYRRSRKHKGKDCGYFRNLFDDDDVSGLDVSGLDDDSSFYVGSLSSFDDDIGGTDEYAIYLSKQDQRNRNSVRSSNEGTTNFNEALDKITDIAERLDNIEDRITGKPQRCVEPLPTTTSGNFQQLSNEIIRGVSDIVGRSAVDTNNRIDELSDRMDAICESADATFNDIYNQIGRVSSNSYGAEVPMHQTARNPVKMNTVSSNFVRSSEENNVSEDIIDGNINGALQKN